MLRITRRIFAPAAVLFLTAALCSAPSCSADSIFKATNLLCEALDQPLAIDSSKPHFSWRLSGPWTAEGQSAYQILVATSPQKLTESEADLWNSGKVEDGRCTFIEYAGVPLNPRTLAYWKVRVWDVSGNPGDWSGEARFGIGLLAESDWDAEACFIGAAPGAKAVENAELLGDRAQDINPTRLLRKSFDHSPDGSAVLLHVNSLGYHEAFINGEKVSDAVLAPAVSQLGRRSLILTYDVSSLLKKGSNEILLWLGDGWYHDYLDGAVPGGPFVRAELDAVSPEGSRTLLVTDASWQSVESGRLTFGSWKPHQMGGEIVDRRLSLQDLSPATLSKLETAPVTVAQIPAHSATPQMCETNIIKESFHPVSVTEEEDGSFIYDFGRCFVGFTEVSLPPVGEGEVIELGYDDLYFKDRPHRDSPYKDFYIGDGRNSGLFSSKFNYKGYRFLRIKGLASALPLKDLTASAVSTGYSGDVTFACSDKDLNDVFSMVKSTLGAITLGGYMVDCPQVERLGYGGDGNASTPTVQTFFNLSPLYFNWMQAWADSQRENGDMPHTAPNPYKAGGGPFWCGFIITASWQTYVNYGDMRLLERYYPQMVKWLDFARANRKDGLLQDWGATEKRHWYLGDWATPAGIDQTDKRSVDLVNNCFLSDCYATMSKICEVLGKYDESQDYLDLRDELNALIHNTFFDKEEASYSTGTQIDLIYPMLVGATPENEFDAVRRTLEERTGSVYGGHLSTGLVGVPVLTRWATENVQADFVYRMLKKRGYPGYLYMIDNGATMTWEHWNGQRSHIHNCYNGIGSWFIQALAGIRPGDGAAGYKGIFIHPQLVEGISWVEASKDSPYGRTALRWERVGEGVVFDVDLPLGTTAAFELPWELELVSVSAGGVTSSAETSGEGSDVLSLLPGHTRISCRSKKAE